VLDLGAGSGFFARYLLDHGSGDEDRAEVPGWLNALLLRWFTFEHRVLPQRLFGLSVLAVGTKTR
jgi:hypothetical protein